ncbi:transmembrane protein 192 isoform X2 [Corvus hawaiiensis]|uniref:transmembrane protein 192 isoform X2 n=1 Tax=Corvus hawaiiensis TaxID=134902 RepID=UPI002019F0F2|nr:transmembrane protein 192 isoform X2 [Corvus hawaiiensis]
MALTAERRRQNLDNGSLEITQSLEDDPLLDAPLISSHTLHSQLRPKFHAISVVLLANFLLLIHVAFVVLAFLAAMFCSYPNPNQDKCPGNYTHPLKVQTVIIIAKVVLWVLHIFFERYVQHHHSRVRRRGYFSIYRSTRHLKRLPLLIHATGNTALLLILSVQHSFPDHSKLYLYLILGVLSLEMISSLTCLVIYTVKISNFNRAKPRPDIIEEEKMYAYPSHITSEVGFRENSSLEEIVEKQGDVIEYLQRHNALLSKRLLALTSQQIKT